MPPKIVIFLVLICFVAGKPFTEGFKYVYNYTGAIILTSNSDTFADIRTQITAQLEIHRLNGKTWYQFKNVSYLASHNDQNGDSVIISEGSLAINLPFECVDESELGIKTMEKDEPWSRNIKNAIVNLFHLDDKVFETVKSGFFKSNKYDYYVHRNNVELNVTRMMSEDCFKYAKEPRYFNFKKGQSVLPMIKNQEYKLILKDDNWIIQNVDSNANIYYNSFDGNIEKFYAFTIQSLKIDSFEKNNFEIPSEKFEKIDSNPDINLTESGYYDITAGRQKIDPDKLMVNIKNDLIILYKNMLKNRITLSKNEIKHKISIDSVLYRLKSLNTHQIEYLYKSMLNSSDKNVLEVYLQMLSLTGTLKPYMFLLKLISDKKITNSVAITIFENMPKHVRTLPKNFLNKFYETVENVKNENVKYTGLLALTSLISHIKRDHEIVDEIMHKIDTLEDRFEKIVYLNALKNIKSPVISEFLMEYAGNVNLDGHIRSIAIMGIDNIPLYHDYFWHLFTNRTEVKEVRYTLLHLLMHPMYSDNLGKMFRYIDESVESLELKNLYKTRMQSLKESSSSHFESSIAKAKELSPYIYNDPVNQFVGSSYIIDYLDGLETLTGVTYFGNLADDNFTSIHLNYYGQSSILTESEIYLHIESTSDKIGKLETVYDLFKISDQVLDSDFYLTFVSNGMVKKIINLKKDKDGNIDFNKLISDMSMYIDQALSTEVVIMTDIGIPLVFYDYVSEYSKNKFGNFNRNQVYGFVSFNPILNTWYGINRIHIMDGYFPIGLKFNMNTNDDDKFVVAKLKFHDDQFGIQSYVYSGTFFKEEENGDSVRLSCPNCTLFKMIADEDALKTHTLLEGDSEILDLKFKMAIFDTTSDVNPKKLFLDLVNEIHSNSFNPIKLPFVINQELNKYMLSPEPGAKGLGIMIQKRDEGTAKELIFRFDTSYNKTTDTIHRNYRLSYGQSEDASKMKSFEIVHEQDKYFNFTITNDDKHTKDCLTISNIWGYDMMESTIIITSDDKKLLEALLSAKPAHHQTNQHLGKRYDECDSDISKSFVECVERVSSFDSYHLDVKYSDLSDKQMDMLIKLSDFWRTFCAEEYIRLKHPKNVNSTTIDVEFKNDSSWQYMKVVTPYESYAYDELAIINYVNPLSPFTTNSPFFEFYCEARDDSVKNSEYGINYELKYEGDWAVLYKGEDDLEIKLKPKDLNVKKDTNEFKNLLLYVKFKTETVEVSRLESEVKISINGKEVPLKTEKRYSEGKWINYMLLKNENNPSKVLINIKQFRINILYDSTKVKITTPFLFDGECTF